MNVILEKIRSILRNRYEKVCKARKIFSSENREEVCDKIDALSSMIDCFCSSLRSDDDLLMTTVFEAQNQWYELTKKLREDLVKLNKRIVEVEELLLEKVQTRDDLSGINQRLDRIEKLLLAKKTVGRPRKK